MTVFLGYYRFSDQLPNLALYHSYLSADELARAERFHFEVDRQCFILARGALRKTLSLELKLSPTQIIFDYEENGKPFLPGMHLHFNLSHTRRAFLIGFSFHHKLGVDLEDSTRDIVLEDISATVFSQAERDYLSQLPSERKQFGFYRSWSRKEAFVKGLGLGISMPLTSLSLTQSDEPQLSFEWEQTTWQISDLPSYDEHSLALAVEGKQPSKIIWKKILSSL